MLAKLKDATMRILTGTTQMLPIVSEIVTIPDANVVLNVTESIQDACASTKVHKSQFDSIQNYIEELRDLLKQHLEFMEGTSLSKSGDYNIRELEKIKVDLQAWSSYSWWKALFYNKIIDEGLKAHRESLQRMINQYHYQVGVINAMLSNEAAEAAGILHETLTSMIDQSYQDDTQLFDDSKSPITRVQFEIRFKTFQNQLKEITKRTGRLAPPQLNNAELVIPNHRIIDSGMGSDVLQGLYLGTTKVAIKRLRGLYVSDKYIRQFNNEFKVWSSVQKHERLLLFIGWYKDVQEFALVSEWQDNGNITKFCIQNRDADRLHLLAGVADGLNFLHSLSLNEACVHGNLKGANILINDKREAMLYDFQLSKIVRMITQEHEQYDSFTRSPSIRWTSPETIADRTMMPPGDVWSFAMVMIEVFTLQEPFPECPSELTLSGRIRFRNLRPNRPQTDWVTDGVWRLMERCWKTPDERPKMDEVHKLVLEAEKERNENPPTVRFDHPKYNRFAHLERRYDITYP